MALISNTWPTIFSNRVFVSNSYTTETHAGYRKLPEVIIGYPATAQTFADNILYTGNSVLLYSAFDGITKPPYKAEIYNAAFPTFYNNVNYIYEANTSLDADAFAGIYKPPYKVETYNSSFPTFYNHVNYVYKGNTSISEYAIGYRKVPSSIGAVRALGVQTIFNNQTYVNSGNNSVDGSTQYLKLPTNLTLRFIFDGITLSNSERLKRFYWG